MVIGFNTAKPCGCRLSGGCIPPFSFKSCGKHDRWDDSTPTTVADTVALLIKQLINR